MRPLLQMAAAFHAESPTFRDMAFDPQQLEDFLDTVMDNPDWYGAIAHDDRGPCGMALVYCMETIFGPTKECCDMAFYVIPERRHGRCAGMILDQLVTWAFERGAVRFTIADRSGISGSDGTFWEKKGLERQGAIFSTALPF